jgi:hypothetical protein
VRSHDARRQDAAPVQFARHDSSTIRTPGSAFEQEYFFYKDGAPLGFPTAVIPAPQGPYYTGVGYKNVG